MSVITTPDHHPTASSSAELQRVGGDAESRNDEDLESNGEVLCLLKFGTNGVLEVSPDFSHGRKPYRQAFLVPNYQNLEFESKKKLSFIEIGP